MARRIGLVLILCFFALLTIFSIQFQYMNGGNLIRVMRIRAASAAQKADSGGGGIYLPILFKEWPRLDRTGEALLISEVVYDPLTAEPGSEWIELYNPSRQIVELTHVKVGDEETAGGGEGMVRFPPGSTMSPGQVLVIANKASEFFNQYGFWPDFELSESDPFIPTLVRYASWAGGNVVLLNTSDEVLILGDQDQLVDAVSWGGSTFAFDPAAPDVASGHSLERRPAQWDSDAASDWVDQIEPGPGEVDTIIPSPTPVPATETPAVSSTPEVPTVTLTPFAGLVVLSEVMYDPVGAEPGGEWIELYNPGMADLSLAQFKVGDEEQAGGGEGMYAFPAGAVLPAGQVKVIAVEAGIFYSVYGIYPDFELVDTELAVPDMEKYAGWASGSLSLSNVGDEVLLLNGADELVDAVSWGSSDFAFTPPVPDVVESHSLERRPADQDTDTAVDWIDQPSPAPGQINLEPLPPTPTQTSAVSPSPTFVATLTGTALPTGTASPLPSMTPFFTETPTPAPTGTPILTATPTPTAQAVTPTLTPPSSATPDATATPAASMTPTATSMQTATSTGLPSETPGPDAHLLISEVFYDTPGTDAQEEWIEIYNPGTLPVDLSLYKVGDEEASGGSEGMFQFPLGSILAPGERVVIALEAAGFAALYGENPDFEIQESDPGVPDMIAYPEWSSGTIAMSNSGDEVVLLNGLDLPVDVLVYENGSFAGVVGHGGVGTGHSLERWPPGQDTDDCSLDFIDQEVPNPGM